MITVVIKWVTFILAFITIDDNGGLYYRAPFTQEVYLPLVLRGWP